MINNKFFKKIIVLLPVVLFGIAVFIIHRQLEHHALPHFIHLWNSVPWSVTACAMLLTLLSYFLLSFYDLLALRSLGYKEISYPNILLTSFISFAISNNTGHAWAAGGSVRYRFYSENGVQGWDIAKISLFLSVTFFIGVVSLGLIAISLAPSSILNMIQHMAWFYLLIVLCSAFLIAYWGMVIFRKKPFQIKGISIAVPSVKVAILQTLLACADLLLAALVLWVFVQDLPAMTFEIFLIIFILSQFLGLISQVPGGIGVFEGTFLGLSGLFVASNRSEIAIALILYRSIYYFLPLLLAGLVLLIQGVRRHRAELSKVEKFLARVIPSTLPQILSILFFITGAYLLFSGSLPILPEKIRWLHRFIPLSLVEFSHLTGSLIGILLLFLARGIHMKLDAAWYGVLILLSLGILTSALRGFDWFEILALSVLFIVMLFSHRYFYRKSSLLQISYDPVWFGMIVMVLIGTVWFGLFSYRHIEYSSQLWWQFSYKDNASRFLRSLIVIGVVVLVVLIWQLLKVAKPKALNQTHSHDLQKAAELVSKCQGTQGYLALLGDKQLFWSEGQTAFLAYAVTPKYWIVMGDPVGNQEDYEQLLWEFKEQADRFGAKIAFYQVGENDLPLYLDLGLTLLKLGQEARVPLISFSLDGRKRNNLRTARNRLFKQGYQFKILEYSEVEAALPRLKQISDAWLKQKNVREKRFSLGFFDENYIQRTRVAVAISADNEIMAFANVWETQHKEELSIDLMRYDPTAPNGIMDFVFSSLMLWAKDQGYQWFNLGMAPLSGLERHPLAPLWHKIGTTIFDLGEEFYNFEGLYEYKAKFDPEWQSRYLASPAGLSAPFVLLAITQLIAGGWKGIIGK
ncbi:bifunctional lysylphosphatidylglycerol flippase/synthetase MprF [Acinetobacter sp.]|uniref:bifunctional lysylphosphatidylglycerol flippase/synthetase MprF n=1 Tax=Acinetobacter sp. TaxID=472 RepID=UPI0031D56A2A